MLQGVCGEPTIYILAVGNYVLIIQECITKYIAKLFIQRTWCSGECYSSLTSNDYILWTGHRQSELDLT